MTGRAPPAAPRLGNPLLTRRRLLATGGVAAAALGAGAFLAQRGSSERYDAILREGRDDGSLPAPKTLSRKELAILTVLVDRLVGAEPPFPSPRRIGVAERIDRELAFHHDKMIADVRQALLVVEHGALVRGRLSPFTSLPAEEQDLRLEEMSRGHEIERQVFVAFRTLAVFFYYVDDSTWPHIHYEGPLLGFRTRPAADSRA